MAKDKNKRSGDSGSATATEDDGSFRVSKTRAGKEPLVTVTFQCTETQEAHLDLVCDENDVARSEFVKQAVFYALKKAQRPMPSVGEITEELREHVEKRREERSARRAARSGEGE